VLSCAFNRFAALCAVLAISPLSIHRWARHKTIPVDRQVTIGLFRRAQ
jgi:hypothetical protein